MKAREIVAKLFEIEIAREIWREAILEDQKKHGNDEGTCVLGAGIAVPYANAHVIIIRPPTKAQGASTWERSMPRVLEYLHRNGVPEAFYHPGNMD